jgi:hypothetical protein
MEAKQDDTNAVTEVGASARLPKWLADKLAGVVIGMVGGAVIYGAGVGAADLPSTKAAADAEARAAAVAEARVKDGVAALRAEIDARRDADQRVLADMLEKHTSRLDSQFSKHYKLAEDQLAATNALSTRIAVLEDRSDRAPAAARARAK